MILHVDDLMIAGDGSPATEDVIEKLHKRFPFGEWVKVKDVDSVTYTGRTIVLEKESILIHQADFVHGRMTLLESSGNKSRADVDPCSPEEKAEFRSCVGNLHWVTAQTRLDRAVDTSKFQQRLNAPSWADFKGLSKVVKEVKATAEVGIRLRPISKP